MDLENGRHLLDLNDCKLPLKANIPGYAWFIFIKA